MLTDSQIQNYLPGCRVILYSMLEQIHNIDAAIPRNGLFILFPGKFETQGHWVVLFKEGSTLYYYDPYGQEIDQAQLYKQGGWDDNGWRRLTFLLSQSKYNIDWNNWQQQSADFDNVTDCGWWCLCRIKLRHFTTDQFGYVWRVKEGETLPDDLVEEFVKNY